MASERIIRNCHPQLSFQCPLRWELLLQTKDPSIRACNTCHRSVYACDTPEAAEEQAKNGRVIAVVGPWEPPRQARISIGQLRKAQEAQSKDGGRIGYRLIKTGAIEESKLTEFLSKQYGVPSINLKDFAIDPEFIKLVPKDVAMKHQIIPVNRAGATLIIAMSDPSNIFAIDDVKFLTGYNIETVVASEVAIREAIAQYYGPQEPNGDSR